MAELTAYCVKCRAKQPITNPTPITMKNGQPGTRGTCPACGTALTRMGKAPD